ncbi:MAG: hypothetical protein ACRD15_15835, partial [Vicinamibacterales bacterium]
MFVPFAPLQFFLAAEVPTDKHGKSEDPSVIAADDAEQGAHRPRSRIGSASPRDVATSPNDVKGRRDPMVTASTPGTVRS